LISQALLAIRPANSGVGAIFLPALRETARALGMASYLDGAPAREIRDYGNFSFVANALPFTDANDFMASRHRPPQFYPGTAARSKAAAISARV